MITVFSRKKSFLRGSIRSRKGFTLVEILLAITIGASVLMAATSLLYSMGKVWLNEQSGSLFYQHCNHLNIFLQQSFERSVRPSSLPRVRWERPPEWSEFDDPLLCFELDETPPLLYENGEPLYHLTCYFYFTEKDGLCLLWYSKQYAIEKLSDLYLTQLSPYAKSIHYIYYDTDMKEWRESDTPEKERSGKWVLPEALRFTLEHNEDVRELIIALPTKQQFATF